MSFKENLLTIPACASDVSGIIKKIDPVILRSMFTTSGAFDPRMADLVNLPLIEQAICKQGLKSEVCFYPFGGADTMSPALVTGSRFTLMTGSEPWGYADDLPKLLFDPLRLFGVGGTTYNQAYERRGTFDSYHGWEHKDENGRQFSIETSLGTMGPHAVLRAVAAEMIQGRTVKSVHIAGMDEDLNTGCLLDNEGNLRFKKIGADALTREPDSNVAYWLTMESGEKKAYLYKTMHLKDDDFLRASAKESNIENGFSIAQEKKIGEINDLHQILSKISGNRELVVIEKGIPQDLLESPKNPALQKRAEELISPPSHLVRAVICDEKLNEKTSQKICMDGFQEKAIDLKPFGVAFGYGNTLYIHARPGSLPDINLKIAAFALEKLSNRHMDMLAKSQRERYQAYESGAHAPRR
jgi:hypothetical protein